MAATVSRIPVVMVSRWSQVRDGRLTACRGAVGMTGADRSAGVRPPFSHPRALQAARSVTRTTM